MRGMFFLLGYFFAERNIDCRLLSLISFRKTSFVLEQMLPDDIPWLNLCQIIFLSLGDEAIKSKITLVK
jgi:hypothetical protein